MPLLERIIRQPDFELRANRFAEEVGWYSRRFELLKLEAINRTLEEIREASNPSHHVSRRERRILLRLGDLAERESAFFNVVRVNLRTYRHSEELMSSAQEYITSLATRYKGDFLRDETSQNGRDWKVDVRFK